MNEQKEIADVVLDTPEPDRWVDCGESRPLPMFHMHTLMQYGERCAEAALAWLRSQGEPVVWMYERDGTVHDGMYPPMFLQKQRPLDRDDNWTETPLYLAPRVIEGDDREYLSAIAHLGRAMSRLVIAARTSGGTAGPDAELMAACAQAEDAMSVGAIGRAMEAPQPAIPDGWQPIESAPKDGTSVLVFYSCATVPVVHIAWYRSRDEWESSGQYCGGWESLEEWEGWWSYTQGSVSQEKLDDYKTPTHWMPLPDAPEPSK